MLYEPSRRQLGWLLAAGVKFVCRFGFGNKFEKSSACLHWKSHAQKKTRYKAQAHHRHFFEKIEIYIFRVYFICLIGFFFSFGRGFIVWFSWCFNFVDRSVFFDANLKQIILIGVVFYLFAEIVNAISSS